MRAMGAVGDSGEFEFDLTTAARSIAVSTLAYHQPYTRGMNLDVSVLDYGVSLAYCSNSSSALTRIIKFRLTLNFAEM